MAVQERRNGVHAVSTAEWKTNVTEASFRMGLAKLDKPFNLDNMRNIINETGLVAELSGYARSLIKNGTDYAEKSLGWGLKDVEERGVYADPNLVTSVRLKLMQRGVR